MCDKLNLYFENNYINFFGELSIDTEIVQWAWDINVCSLLGFDLLMWVGLSTRFESFGILISGQWSWHHSSGQILGEKCDSEKSVSVSTWNKWNSNINLVN